MPAYTMGPLPPGPGEYPEVVFTAHAQARMREMGVDRHEVRDGLQDPETTYPSGPHYGSDCEIVTWRRLAIVVAVDALLCTVVTVLWNRGTGRTCAPTMP